MSIRRLIPVGGFVSVCLAGSLWAFSGQAQGDYNAWMRIAEQARKQGDFGTALINYGRADRLRPNDSAVNAAVSQLLEERLQSLQPSAPQYVALIRTADSAYFSGDYLTAIANYKSALQARPGDYYAKVRVQQAECIQTKKPATGGQFNLMCPSLFPR